MYFENPANCNYPKTFSSKHYCFELTLILKRPHHKANLSQFGCNNDIIITECNHFACFSCSGFKIQFQELVPIANVKTEFLFININNGLWINIQGLQEKIWICMILEQICTNKKIINQVTQKKYRIPEFSCSLHNKQIGTIHNC